MCRRRARYLTGPNTELRRGVTLRSCGRFVVFARMAPASSATHLRHATITTPRLRVRPFEMSDAAHVAEICSDWAVASMCRFVPHPYTLEDARSFITQVTTNKKDTITCAIEHGTILIGCISLDGLSFDRSGCWTAALGYWVDRAAWGRGFATEAATALLTHAFGDANDANTCIALYSGYWAENTASARVQAKLGFRPIGKREQLACAARGCSLEQVRTQLTRQEWLQRHTRNASLWNYVTRAHEMKERLFFIALALLRIGLTLSPGYVHPDEFFQTIEPAAHLVGLHAELPWEFSNDVPARSWLPAVAVAAWPLWLVRACVRKPSAMLLLCAARLPSCALSFFQDAALVKVCRMHELPHWHLLLVHASAWPTLVFGARTFSNSLEATILAVALLALVAMPAQRASRRCAVLGVLLSIGCWVRFTFVLYWLPLGVASITGGYGGHASTSPDMSTTHWRVGSLLVAAACTALPLLALDCVHHDCLDAPWRCVTPINAARYNASPRNLAEHGLHPRSTHVLINLPLLAGPLAIAAAADLVRTVLLKCKPEHAAAQASSEADGASSHLGSPPPRLRRLLLVVVVLPLLALSAAPHQEARFLIPMMVPLTLLYGHTLQPTPEATRQASCAWRTWRLAAWMATQLIVGAFFTFAHQGGVVRAVEVLQRAAPSPPLAPPMAIFFRTYTPPRSLLGASAATAAPWQLVDLGGGGVDELTRTLHTHLGRCRIRRGVAPAYVILPAKYADALRYNPGTSGWCRAVQLLTRGRADASWPVLERRLWPHWSGEDPPRTPSEAALEVYRVA